MQENYSFFAFLQVKMPILTKKSFFTVFLVVVYSSHISKAHRLRQAVLMLQVPLLYLENLTLFLRGMVGLVRPSKLAHDRTRRCGDARMVRHNIDTLAYSTQWCSCKYIGFRMYRMHTMQIPIFYATFLKVSLLKWCFRHR